LEWLDRINGLRELAIETEAREVESACTRIVRQSRAVLELFHVELENIEIGRTLYDSRLHELLHAIPRAGVRPETIIGIQKLGYRRDGKTVRKPMVVVAASGN
jgi:molecular chaperone GrpE (heat shock protein)